MNYKDYEDLFGYHQDVTPQASPAAQTFTAGRSAFLKNVDLYFTSKDPSPNADGILMEIRDVHNNHPGNRYYAKTYVPASDIHTEKINGGEPTEFSFTDPVFLEQGHQYAIVLFTKSTKYQLAVAVFNQLNQNNNLAVSKKDSQNPSAYVMGQLYYSMNGVDWSNGYPADIDTLKNGQSQGGETTCLKFTINTCHFNTSSSDKLFKASLNNNYQVGDTNKGMNDFSYMTFYPTVFTPHNTSIDWYYNFDNSLETQAHPLIPGHSYHINSNAEYSTLYIWAHLNGNGRISPVIDRKAMHVVLQLSKGDNDGHTDVQLKTQSQSDIMNFFDNQIDDTESAGEYVSRTVDFSNTYNSRNSTFNNIYASYEVLSDGASRPVDLFVNLNSINDPQSNYKNEWIQVPGYDVEEDNKWYTIDPYQSYNAYDYQTKAMTSTSNLDTVHDLNFHEQVSPGQDPDKSWQRYHFHLSLDRLSKYPVVNLGNQRSSLSGEDNPMVSNSNNQSNNVKWKIIIHSNNQDYQPKVRKFRSTVNQENDNDVNMNTIKANN